MIERRFVVPVGLQGAHAEHALRCAFDENDLLAIRHAVERRHVAVLCIERDLVQPRPLSADVVGLEAGLGSKRDERALHRVAMDRPRLAVLAEMGVVAQEPGAYERQCRGTAHLVARIAGKCQLTARRVAGTARDNDAVRGDEPFRRHLVARERAGLVRADDRCRTQRLDRGEAADHGIAGGHALHANRERDRDDGRQPLRDDADRKRDDRDKGIRPREIAHQDGEGE